MTINEMRTLGNDCYAAFNQKAPESGSRAWTLWTEICREVPVEAALWIRGKILESDTLPRNFGKAVHSLYADWRAEHGRPAPAARGCAACDKETPGFFTVWSAEGNRVLCRCLCNRGTRHQHMPWRSPADMARLGYVIRPQGFRGSVMAFERERFLAPGRKAAGGNAPGGNAPGGNAPGGSAAGGYAPGGSAAGGYAAGAHAAGGYAAGAHAAGGNAPGGSAAGGYAAGGSAAGAHAARRNTAGEPSKHLGETQ